jgi:DNA-binding beta-propeller fold protein YncE
MRIRIASIAVALALATLLAVAQAGDAPDAKPPAPLALVQTIALPKVEGRLDHFALDAKRGRLYLAALGNGSVEIVSLEKGERAKQITGLSEPQGVAFAPDLDRLVVACGGDGTLRFYSGDTAEPAAKIDLGSDADNVRYDPATQRFFVGAGDGSVTSVNAKKPAAVATADLGAHPESLQVETTGRRLFVNVERAAEVAVVDRFDMTVKARWKLGDAKANFPLALDEAGKRLFVGCRRPACIVTLSTDDGKVLATTDCSDDPDDVFLDAARRRVYVSCGAGFVDVFERGAKDALERVAKVETRRGARTAFFDAASDRLFVAVPKTGDKDAEIRVFAPR